MIPFVLELQYQAKSLWFSTLCESLYFLTLSALSTTNIYRVFLAPVIMALSSSRIYSSLSDYDITLPKVKQLMKVLLLEPL